jgi:hypothetical protein
LRVMITAIWRACADFVQDRQNRALAGNRLCGEKAESPAPISARFCGRARKLPSSHSAGRRLTISFVLICLFRVLATVRREKK